MKDANSNQPKDLKQALQLYQAVILEHNKSPFGYGLLKDPTHKADGFNPICGDKVEITVSIQEGVLVQIGFETQSCALCRASSSVLSKHLIGMKLSEAMCFSEEFERMIFYGDKIVAGEAAVFVAIKDFPARAKCVVLPWRTLCSALKGDFLTMKQVSVTTEV